MQVKFRYGTKEQIKKLQAVRPWITEAEVYFDKEDGSLYVVSFNSGDGGNVLETSFEKYIEEQLRIQKLIFI